MPASTAEALNDPSSAQSQALEVLEQNSDTNTDQPFRLSQQFALLTLAYGNSQEARELQEDAGVFGNWDPSINECEWTGIQCNPNNNRVIGIEIVGENIRGILPPELSALPGLRRLILSDNRLRGTVPAEYANLDLLETLHIDFNRLQGRFPNEIFVSMSSLRFLEAQGNSFTDGLSREICDLELEELYVDCDVGQAEERCWTKCRFTYIP